MTNNNVQLNLHTQPAISISSKCVNHLESVFLQASEKVQANYTIEAITRKWNASLLGNPAKQITVERWLRKGPSTKNPRFETWIVGLASNFN